jgi:hypothetical protein
MLGCLEHPGLIPSKLDRPLGRRPNVMVKALSSSWCFKFICVNGRSLGCGRSLVFFFLSCFGRQLNVLVRRDGAVLVLLSSDSVLAVLSVWDVVVEETDRWMVRRNLSRKPIMTF